MRLMKMSIVCGLASTLLASCLAVESTEGTRMNETSQSAEATQFIYESSQVAEIPEVSNDTDQAQLPPFPSEIQLDFQPLELQELPKAVIEQGWELKNTLSFGRIDDAQLSLAIYKEDTKQAYSLPNYYAVLNMDGNAYLIRDVSDLLAELTDGESGNCPALCLLQQLLPNQDRYELIGTIALFANGPGLRGYVIYDREAASLVYFDQWGEPDFPDLDSDGTEEFLIQLPGLHLQAPDVSVVRESAGVLYRSVPVMEQYKRQQGDYAIFAKEMEPPFIRLGHMWQEMDPIVYDYRYAQGILVLEEAYVVE